MMKNNPEELELAKEVARKAKKLAQEQQDKMLATVRAEFYVQLSEVLKAGVVKAATWHVGNTPPADFGRAGDLYLDITTADVLFNNAGEWQVVLNVRPKDGIDGKDGEKGEKGDRGATGLAGERGKAGRDGKDGKDGKNGRDGVDGARGKDGKDGRDGSRWYAEKGKPTYTIGKKGDFFIDSTTGDFYQKTSDLSWVKKGSLKPDAVAGGFIVSNNSSGSGEGGAVNSVNSKTGDVVINPDDLDDSSTTNKFITASELADIASNTTARHTHSNKSVLDATTASFTTADETKLDGIASGATANDTDANLKNRANHTGTQDVSTITGLADVATSGDYNDLSNTPDLSVFDELEQFATSAGFPATGNSAKFYLAQDSGILYRWGGSSYVEISASLALGETSSTAYRGDRGKTAYDHSQLTSGNPHNVSKTDVGLGNVDNTSDANKPISTATQTALDSKLDDTQFSGLSKITVGTTAPTSPAVGDLWVDTN